MAVFTKTLTFDYGAGQFVDVQQDAVDPPSFEGFTPIIPVTEGDRQSRLIYVSSSQGDDLNDGLSEATPVASLAAGFGLMRRGYPDHCYFKCGDVWTEVPESNSGYLKGSEDENNKSVLASYGEGPRPEFRDITFRQDGSAGGSLVINQMMWVGLYFHSYVDDVEENPGFDPALTSPRGHRFVGNHIGLHIEDCKFRYFKFYWQGLAGGIESPKDLTIRRCIFDGIYEVGSSISRNSRPSLIFTSYTAGFILIEDNVFDKGGWHKDVFNASANLLAHNIYMYHVNSNNCIFRNNISCRASSHGYLGRNGGLIQDNFLGRNSLGLNCGHNDRPFEVGMIGHVYNNVCNEGVNMFKGTNPTRYYEGASICSSAVFGITLEGYGVGDVIADGNISSLIGPDTNQWQEFFLILIKKFLEYNDESGGSPVTATNQVGYHWNSDTQGDEFNYPDPNRTLGEYYTENIDQNALVSQGVIDQVYAGENDFDGNNEFDTFMLVAKNRNAGTWSADLTAINVNAYIREGFLNA